MGSLLLHVAGRSGERSTRCINEEVDSGKIGTYPLEVTEHRFVHNGGTFRPAQAQRLSLALCLRREGEENES